VGIIITFYKISKIKFGFIKIKYRFTNACPKTHLLTIYKPI
jgi:hypothetical protein